MFRSHISGRKFKNLLLLALLTVAVYANSLPNSFSLDDPNFVVNNKAVHGFSLANIKAVFTSVPNGVEYLPVKDLTYMLDYSIWKLDPLGYHISNLVFYLLGIILFYLFLEEILPGQAAFLAALIYAVHPGHVESVACVAQRKDLVSGALYFTALLLYAKNMKAGGKGRYMASLLLLAPAMLSKMTAVMMPVSVLLLESFFGDRPLKKRLLRAAPFFALSAALAVLGIFVAKSTKVYIPGAGLSQRIPGAFEAVWVYLKILVFPYPLKVWYKFSMPGGFLEPLPALAVLGAGGLVALVFFMRKKYKAVSFGMAWMLASMVPVAGLFPTSVVITERYLFLPSAGFCLALGWTIYRLLANRKAALAVVCAALVTVFAAISFERNLDWRNDITLFTADLGHSPDLNKTYFCLGRQYCLGGDFSNGLKYLHEYKKLAPDTYEYEFFTAYYLFRRGDYDLSLNMLKDIESHYKEDVSDVDFLYGRMYQLKGERDKAQEYYLRAYNAAAGNSFWVFAPMDAKLALEDMNSKK